MATFPTGIYSPTVVADNVDDVLASDQNVPNAEIVAVETAIGINPTTIDDTVAPAAPSSIADFMDKIANIVKTQSGSTTWTNAAVAAIMKSIGTTKGDLISFTGSATPVRHAVGANNQIIVADSSQSDGWKWAFPTLNLSDGSVINGKISPTVTSGSITLALKTLAGNNPSTGEPVYIQIGNVLRSVTSTLSVTVSQGSTNPFNAGSSELATKEIDFFPYFSYVSTSSAIAIGFARFPFARLYSDFNGTVTNEKYGAFSTAPASTDNVIEFGRFAATVSAGSTYSWTVPTYTNINLIQSPIYQTRSLTWNPTVTSGAGTPTTVGKTATYSFDRQRIHCNGHMVVTNKGTATGAMKLTTPFTLIDAVGYGQEVAITGVGGAVVSISNLIYITKYDATSPWTDTWDWYFQYHAPLA